MALTFDQCTPGTIVVVSADTALGNTEGGTPRTLRLNSIQGTVLARDAGSHEVLVQFDSHVRGLYGASLGEVTAAFNRGYLFRPEELSLAPLAPELTASPVAEPVAEPTLPEPAQSESSEPGPVHQSLRVKLPRVKVVAYGEYGYSNLDITPGSLESVASRIGFGVVCRTFLPKSAQSLVGARECGSLTAEGFYNRCGRRGVTITDAIDAVRKALEAAQFSQEYARQLDGKVQVESPDEDLLDLSSDVILMAGSTMFKLLPVKGVSGAKTLRELRRRAVAQAEVQAKGVLEAASREADNLLYTARTNLTKIKDEVAVLERTKPLVVPKWLASAPDDVDGRPIVLGMMPLAGRTPDYKTFLGFNISMKPTEFSRTETDRSTGEVVQIWRWPARVEPPVRDEWALILVPYNANTGEYYFLGSRISKLHKPWVHPHINNDKTCMVLEGLPGKIDSTSTYDALRRAIQRGVRSINLSSPLSDITEWFRCIVESIPPGLNEAIRNGYDRRQFADGQLPGGIPTMLETERDGTVTIERLNAVLSERERRQAARAVADLARELDPPT